MSRFSERHDPERRSRGAVVAPLANSNHALGVVMPPSGEMNGLPLVCGHGQRGAPQ